MFRKTLAVFILLASAIYAQDVKVTSSPSPLYYYQATEATLQPYGDGVLIGARDLDKKEKGGADVKVEVAGGDPSLALVRAWLASGPYNPFELPEKLDEKGETIPGVFLLIGTPGEKYKVEVIYSEAGKRPRWKVEEVTLPGVAPPTKPPEKEPEEPTDPPSDDAALLLEFKNLSKEWAIKVGDKPTAKALGQWWIGLEKELKSLPLNEAIALVAKKREEIFTLRPKPLKDWTSWVTAMDKMLVSTPFMNPQRYAAFIRAIGEGLVEASQ